MEQLIEYLSYPFVRYAFIVGILIALTSALLGVPLVLKRFSFIGDGLSHVAFGAMAVAAVLNVTNQMIIIFPITVAAAVILLKGSQNTKIKGDASLAMISVGALAIGYLLLNKFSTSTNVSGDVCTTLFGSTSILTLNALDVWVCVIMSFVVLLLFFFCYHKIFSVTFDEDFARATGTKAEGYNLLLAVITATVIVLAMKLVGSLLISALIIFPAISAMGVIKSFRGVLVLAAVFSVLSALIVMILSLLVSTPVGATIVSVNIVVFGLTRLYGLIGK